MPDRYRLEINVATAASMRQPKPSSNGSPAEQACCPPAPRCDPKLQLFGRVRIMKVSKEYSATCHHKLPSLRNSVCESRIFLKSGLDADVSELTSFEAFRHASMIG